MGINSNRTPRKMRGTDTRGEETHGEEETPVTSKLRGLCRSSQAMQTQNLTGEAVRLDLIMKYK